MWGGRGGAVSGRGEFEVLQGPPGGCPGRTSWTPDSKDRAGGPPLHVRGVPARRPRCGGDSIAGAVTVRAAVA